MKQLVKSKISLLVMAGLLSGCTAELSHRESLQSSAARLTLENVETFAKQKFYDSNPEDDLNFAPKILRDTGVTGDLTQQVTENVQHLMNIFKNYFNSKEVTIVLFDSPVWAKSTLQAQFYSEDFQSTIDQDFSTTGLFGSKCSDGSDYSKGMDYSEIVGFPLVAISIQCGASDISETSVHEMTHVFQALAANYSSCLPAWFEEGQAQFVSAVAIQESRSGNHHSFTDTWYVDYLPNANLGDLRLEEVKNDWQVSKSIEFGPYSDGAFAVQYLVAKFGWELVSQLVIQTADASCDRTTFPKFKDVFKRHTKMSVQQFYVDVQKYLRFRLDRVQPNTLFGRLNFLQPITWLTFSTTEYEESGMVGFFQTNDEDCTIWEYDTMENALSDAEEYQVDNPTVNLIVRADRESSHGVVLLFDDDGSQCFKQAIKILHWSID